MDYGKITISDIIKYVGMHKDIFPKGLDTPILTGDFECNYTHGKHSIQIMRKDESVSENSVCLGYEMHENIYPW